MRTSGGETGEVREEGGGAKNGLTFMSLASLPSLMSFSQVWELGNIVNQVARLSGLNKPSGLSVRRWAVWARAEAGSRGETEREKEEGRERKEEVEQLNSSSLWSALNGEDNNGPTHLLLSLPLVSLPRTLLISSVVGVGAIQIPTL
ncbi:hypothetical protein Q8A73_011534 [Channa argus]|nr:hypothetical protein Q8A73_011534 [Channa argus]